VLNIPLGWTPNLEFCNKQDSDEFVYVAWMQVKEPGEKKMKNIFKIGSSKTPRLRAVWLGKGVDILFARRFDRRLSRCIEGQLHKMFAAKRYPAPRGHVGTNEWFALSPEDLGLIQYGLAVETDGIDWSTPTMKMARLVRIW
jgi:hypothetical protein